MSDNGAPATATPRVVAAGEIKKIDPAQFGKKAELTEKLKAILKDVPVLHERMKKAVIDFEEVTNRARAVVDEWEKANAASKS